MVLVRRLEEQHTIKKNAESHRYNEGKYGWHTERGATYYRGKDGNERVFDIVWDHFDFIAYDFLYMMLPQPEIFEIKQVLKIPKTRYEQRHELMLSIIHDRIANREKYEREHFSKTGVRLKRSLYEVCGEDYRALARRKMKGCNHNEDLDILMAFYKPHYKRNYEYGSYEIELDMYEPEHLIGAQRVEWSAKARFKKEKEEKEKETEVLTKTVS